MKSVLKAALLLSSVAFAAHASAQVTFYENSDFGGRQFTTERRIDNLSRFGFNDRASSVIVDRDRWEVCEDAAFGGHCVVLRPGRYPSLAAMGLNDRVSSVRAIRRNDRIADDRYAPQQPAPVADFRRRQGERLYEARVTGVRAVVGPPEQRCWIEREQVTQERRSPNVGGAVAGALLGGILGHQFGGGFGRDVATVGGAVAGGTVGANVNSRGQQVTTQDVQHCSNTGRSERPDYWDVTYNFRGVEHRVQLSAPPGATVTVNDNGEPRA